MESFRRQTKQETKNGWKMNRKSDQRKPLPLIHRLFRTLVLFLFVVIAVIGIYGCRVEHPSKCLDIQGVYVMELDSTFICRSIDVFPLGLNMEIKEDEIRLPPFDCVHSGIHDVNTYQDIDRVNKERNGSWEVISSNPDSIFINADSHVLHGKYQITIRAYKTGDLVYTTSNYIYLDNDSTHLCLRKVR